MLVDCSCIFLVTARYINKQFQIEMNSLSIQINTIKTKCQKKNSTNVLYITKRLNV